MCTVKKFDKAKDSYNNLQKLIDVKENPVIKATIFEIIKNIPILGGLISDSMDFLLLDFQEKKRAELIEIILSNAENITSDQVNDIDFIVNLTKTIDAVNRLANNDKIEFWGNLIRNGYLAERKIENDEYEEFAYILNILSGREIRLGMKLFDFQTRVLTENFDMNKNQELLIKKWDEFISESNNELDLTKNEVYRMLKKLDSLGLFTVINTMSTVEELYCGYMNENYKNFLKKISVNSGDTLKTGRSRECAPVPGPA